MNLQTFCKHCGKYDTLVPARSPRRQQMTKERGNGYRKSDAQESNARQEPRFLTLKPFAKIEASRFWHLTKATEICYNSPHMTNSPPETSTTLLRDIASGTGNARWGEFVSRYRPMMFAYLKTHFPAIEAEDMVQETLFALSSILPRYRYAPDETGHFRNYLTGILRNKALKRCERLAKDSALKNSLRQEEAAPSGDPASATDDEWRAAIMEIAMRQLLADDAIHERTKQIFQRVAVDGMPPDEVAAAYGTSRNNVDKIKSRMIEQLREIVRKLKAARDG